MSGSAVQPQQAKPEGGPVKLASEPEKPKQKAWSEWVAVSTAIVAVVAAVTAAQAGGRSNRVILLQNQEADEWALFQSKSIKEHTFKINAELITLFGSDASLDELRQATRARYLKEVERYGKEKAEIQAKAEALKAERLDAGEHGGRFGKGLIALQISIVLSSVAGLTKKKWLWQLSLGLGAIGIVFASYGYFF
jgi:Domain of unknown function (DUF4337)